MLEKDALRAAISSFTNFGYCTLGPLQDPQVSQLEGAYDHLREVAHGILERVARSGGSFAEHYMAHNDQVIVVPESDDARRLCRFEYITEQSPWIKSQLVPLLGNLIYQLTGNRVVLFKDKCNLKSPGGGAFTPHQDISAYLPFGPTYHITAAVFLDSADEENGALQMASNYREVRGMGVKEIETTVGNLPCFPVHDGGDKNGAIATHITKQLAWTKLPTERGGIVLFDSFVPHFSSVNKSPRMRRAFFFTFNFAQEGEHYASYYRKKRQDYLNPMFHIATPTDHSGLFKHQDGIGRFKP